MQDNLRRSPFIVLLKKAWPTIYRIINSTIYFIITTLKNVVKGIMDQLKGQMG
jgi:hypothetical protein